LKTYSAYKIKDSLNLEESLILSDFSYPWSSNPSPAMSFRALWDDDRFYFRFDVEAGVVRTFIKDNHKMEVVNSDRVEIFFRRNERLDPYYCLEMDAHGRVLDYRATFYRIFEYEWQWPGKNQLKVESSKTESGYKVEGSITLASLRELDLLNNDKLQAGLFRGECLEASDTQASFSWISWIKPDSDHPDFHIPSSFGVIELMN
jgi:hypothetical protein